MEKKCGHCKQFKDLLKFSTNPCHKDGINNWCKECVSDYCKNYSIKKKKYLKNYRKKYNLKNKKRLKKFHKLYRETYPERIKISKIQVYFKISKEEATKLYYKKINGKCDICGKKETQRNRFGKIQLLAVDHNHKTNKIRGLLCGHCNHILGRCKDDIKILKKAINYLQRNS